MKATLILTALTICLFSCQQKPSKTAASPYAPIPENSLPVSKNQSIIDTIHEKHVFFFSIESDNGGFNSKTKTAWRLYQSGKKKFTNINLTKEELEAIKHAFLNANFNAFPDTFKPQSDMIIETIPCFYYTMSAEIKGNSKRVHYQNCQTDPAMVKAGKPFLKLYVTVLNILEQNADVKRIPQSDVLWE